MMKKLKWLLYLLLFLVVTCFIAIKLMSEKEPDGIAGQDADQLAQNVLTALNKPAFDSLAYLQWTFFRGEHHYKWDKRNNIAVVSWAENDVILDLDQVLGRVSKHGKLVTDPKLKQSLTETAWSYWCNDSFWLLAPFKLFDPGVERSIVKTENKNHLKIRYMGGGVTPGDIYLWTLDENYVPVSWKMWTQIIPVKGVGATWENYITLPGGAKVSTLHKLGPVSMEMQNIAGGNSLQEMAWSEDTFRM